MKVQSVDDLFMHGLTYLYDAEKQLTEALPKLAEAADNPQLRQAFEQHLSETKEHVARSEEIFKRMNKQPQANPNAVLKQMRQEAEQMIQNTDKGPVRDAALIVAGNQVEHFEMASWGSMRNFAKLLGKNDVANIIQKTLDEEKQADAKLTEIGEQQVNVQALHKTASASAGAR